MGTQRKTILEIYGEPMYSKQVNSKITNRLKLLEMFIKKDTNEPIYFCTFHDGKVNSEDKMFLILEEDCINKENNEFIQKSKLLLTL